jgi:SAM-dependent methyltransferase
MTIAVPTQGTSTTPGAVDLTALKARQQTMWASGDFAVVGTTLQIVGETLCEAVDLCAGERVLDVACGNGNATLAAARRFAAVTGLDYVPKLLAGAEARAQAEGLTIAFQLGDAEQMPFGDASFDVVLSTYGVMFAPNQEQAASEMLRVCAPGGRIGLANWTPEGFIGQLLKTVSKHVPPPAGVKSPVLWGTEARLRELFGDRASRLEIARRQFNFRYLSAAHFIDVFRRFYGPTHKAFEGLLPAGQEALARDLEALMAGLNRGGDKSLIVPAEYLEVVIEKR